MEASGRHVTLNDVNSHLGEMMQQQNSSPRAYFNGFSSEQMHFMLNRPFEAGCPVQLRTLTEEQMIQIPIMRQVLHLMNALNEKEIKLTAQGYIPPKMVSELYELGTHSWGSDWYKQKSESKTEEVQVLRVVLKECGLIKIRTGKMSLTAKGRKLLSDHNALLLTILLFLLWDYNVAWLDLYENSEVGNVGRMYSLWLLHHYGEKWRDARFYAEEYYKAFPTLRNAYVYESRVFKRLFRLIGICEINDTEEFIGANWGKNAKKTDILDMIFTFEEPKSV